MRRLILIFLVGGILFVASADACVCTGWPSSIKDEFSGSVGVFLAKIISKEKEKYRVEVLTAWKGNLERFVYIVDPFDQTSCGLSYKIGEEFMFFVKDTNDGSIVKGYEKVDQPIQIHSLKVFFTRPCRLESKRSKWKKMLREYDQEEFWKTVGSGISPQA